MPPIQYDKRSEANLQRELARKNARLDLPEFDSVPATAGLSNLEAFQLSQRHALALLPAMFANEGTEDRADEVTERFSIG